jgi:hypothetical protein
MSQDSRPCLLYSKDCGVIVMRCPAKAVGRTLTHLATRRKRRWVEMVEERIHTRRESIASVEEFDGVVPGVGQVPHSILSGRKCHCVRTGAW